MSGRIVGQVNTHDIEVTKTNMQRVKSAIAGIAGLNSIGRNARARTSQITSTRPSAATDIAASQILASLPLHISSLDRTGVWNTVSAGSCEFFAGIHSTNFLEWTGEYVHVQDRVSVLKAVDDCRVDKKEIAAEFRVSDPSNSPGTPTWVEIKCAPLDDSEQILTILRDISERKSLEHQIRQSRDNADQSNAAKSRFLANMSHELRTPLNAIIGFSDILKCGMVPLDDVEKQLEYQGLINASAHHLLQVLNDILDMSKIEAGKYQINPEEIDLAAIIHSSCSMLMPLAQKAEVNLDLSRVDGSIMMEADSKALRQIIINIVSNAIKFSEPETAVEIIARRLGRKIELQVKDHGRGISHECLDSLGNPFYQVDNDKSRRHEGTGLGLSIVKGLLELHGAKFDIKSSVGTGTTVTITLAQSLGASVPVPADDADTIIRIRPKTSHNRINPGALSRLVS